MFRVPESWRVREGFMATDESAGNNGAFMLPGSTGPRLAIIASDGAGWEHVSVSIPDNSRATPTWEEMDFVKRQFWDDTDCVVQFHVPREDWVNCHPGTLHLWRQVGKEFDRPHHWLVGPKDKK
jgi:hypothetical protein